MTERIQSCTASSNSYLIKSIDTYFLQVHTILYNSEDQKQFFEGIKNERTRSCEESQKKISKDLSTIKLTRKEFNDYKEIYNHTLSVSPGIIKVITEEMLNDWSNKDIISYIGVGETDKNILYCREEYLKGSMQDKN